MKILIGVDDSPHARAAVEFVRKMTWPKDTRVVVLSVAQPAVQAYSEIYVPSAPLVEITENIIRMHQELATGAENTLLGVGLTTEAKVLQGDARTALVDAAHTERADLVVVGSHGRTGLAKLFMGSVASHVVTHAPCSVMVVKLEKP